jgi:hypothetical protein
MRDFTGHASSGQGLVTAARALTLHAGMYISSSGHQRLLQSDGLL